MASKLKFEVVPLDEVSRRDVEVVIGGDVPVVLVVDDEPVIADTLSIILMKSGFSTVTAYDGTTALELARRVRPRLLISDVVMPHMTGIDLAIAVTQLNPECKVLLFSGQASTVDLLAEAREAGYDFTTLVKPVHPADMLRRVSNCLATGDSVSGHGSESVQGGYLFQ